MVVTAVLFGVVSGLRHRPWRWACARCCWVCPGLGAAHGHEPLHQITPEHRHGEALGLRLMAINASSVVMPMLFGTAGAVIGVAGVFWVVGATVGRVHTAWRMNVEEGRGMAGSWPPVSAWGSPGLAWALVCAAGPGLGLAAGLVSGEPPVRLHPVVDGRYLGWAGPHIAPLTTADPRPTQQKRRSSGWVRWRGAPGPVP